MIAVVSRAVLIRPIGGSPESSPLPLIHNDSIDSGCFETDTKDLQPKYTLLAEAGKPTKAARTARTVLTRKLRVLANALLAKGRARANADDHHEYSSVDGFAPSAFKLSTGGNDQGRESRTAAVTRRVHPRRRCGRVARMAKNSGPKDWRWRAWLLPRPAAAALAAMAFLLCLASSKPALAQIDPFGWFEQLFRPNPPPGRVVKPRPENRRAAPEPYLGRPRSNRKAIAKVPAKPAVAPTYFVAVLGDSLAQMLAQGLTEVFENRPEVAILRKAKEDSGLVRDDFFDWTNATRDLLASGEKIDFAVMLIGSNDRQSLRDANGSYEARSPEWQAAYTQRIETIAAMFRDKKIPLVWVGLPILKSERLSADALAFNEYYRAYAEKAGATYIDIWEAFADEAGQYSTFGPDINGQTVRLRAADGVHFTKAGARKLAHFVEPAIRHNLDEAQPNSEPALNPANVANPDGTETPANVSALPGSETPPAPKPVAGPIMPLTGPVLAPGGVLATRTTTAGTANNTARTLIEQTLQQGRPLAPKPGRADDFSWPRN
jgi:hypothetical protein